MAAPVQLIPLVCYHCQAAIPAEIEEVAWVCPQCGAGLLLSEEKGTVPLEIRYATGLQPGKSGLPFWVTQGMVTMRQRQIYGGGDQARQAHEFWLVPHAFYVPAYACTLDQLVEIGTHFLLQPPTLQDGPAGSFQPVVMGMDDVQAYAEFIALGIEASRKDKLKFVDFSLALEPPVLWILSPS